MARLRSVSVITAFVVLVATSLAAATYTNVTTLAGGPQSAAFSRPYGLAVTPSGDLIVADREHHQVKRVTPAGAVTVIAGSGEAGWSDGPANAAKFKAPVAVAYDAPRNIIYVADVRAGLLGLPILDPGDVIRRIAADGTVSTFASGLSDPYGLAVDAAGNVYVSDSGHNTIKKITPAGAVTTIAGSGATGSADGTALQARFNQPNGLAVTATGVLYIADQKNHVIRKLENGVVSTVAGNGSNGWVDGPAASAKFREPRGIALDREGNLLVADSNNSVIRRVTFGASPAVSTIAGNGNAGYADGAVASAKFREPAGLAIGGAVLVADAENDAIRAIWMLPTIASVTPVRGPQLGGNVVQIAGSGFAFGQTQVKFGTASGTAVTVASDAALTVTVPPGISGAVDVTVTTPGGTATLTNGYTYLVPPAIGSVQPAKGATSGGTAVTITGSAFVGGDTAVTFANIPATGVSVIGPTQITATTPAGTAGTVTVDVTTSGGTSSLPNGFRYLAPPVIASFTPATGAAGTVVTVSGSAFDPDLAGNVVKLGAQTVVVTSATATQLTFTVPAGSVTGRISVTTAGGTAVSAADFSTASATLRLTAPRTAFAQGVSVPFNAVLVAVNGTGSDVSAQAVWSSSSTGVATVASNGVTTGVAAGTATITATYSGQSASKTIQIQPVVIPFLAPPPLDTTLAAPLADSVRFLYEGPNAVQTGVAANTIQPIRVGTIRGSVHDRNGNPVAGVQVTIASHPELGQTSTRTDGLFDLAINAGGVLTLRYAKSGYISAERTITTRWLDQKTVDDVVLIGFDGRVTTIASSAAAPQVARGSVITDASGTRQATMVFSAGTAATMTLANGSTQALQSLSVRATEYTVGPSGPKAMPAALPPQSGYTYCVELSVDEAVTADAKTVSFSRPVALYLENFLGFNAGVHVPLGSYDRERNVWMPAADGRVIRIVSIDGTAARVDTNGDGTADDIGIDLAEREQLAALYPAGTTLWRCLIEHFSPYDLNFPMMLPPGAISPAGQPTYYTPCTDPACTGGSIIEGENQTLGEVVPLTGSDFALHYRSDRMPGRLASYTIDIPVTPATIPSVLERVDLLITVAGRMTVEHFTPAPNLRYHFVWDGRDVYGRVVPGGARVTVITSYVYNGRYALPRDLVKSFGLASGLTTGLPARFETSTSQVWTGILGGWRADSLRIGGWTLTPHHFYDAGARTLLRGDGSRKSDIPLKLGMEHADGVVESLGGIAGVSDHTWTSAGGPAKGAKIGHIDGLAIAPDGTIYLAAESFVHKITPSGQLVRVAGTAYSSAQLTDAEVVQPALNARVGKARGIDVGPDGSVYFADTRAELVRRITPDGIIHPFAGKVGNFNQSDYGAEGLPATEVPIAYPTDVKVAPDGSVYIAESDEARVRRVTPDGLIYTIAGNGAFGYSGDGGPATSATCELIGSIALAPDGSLYFTDATSRLRKVDVDGIITTVAGNGIESSTGDGGPSQAASLEVGLTFSAYLSAGHDGSIYIGGEWSSQLRRIDPAGVINTVVGSDGFAQITKDGGRATAQPIESQTTAIGPDGALYFSDDRAVMLRKVAPTMPAYRATGTDLSVHDGGVVHVFTESGRHLRTINADTGAELYHFTYDTRGLLASIVDQDGNTTTVERNASGDAAAIVAPGGQRTELSGAGYLETITTAPGEVTRFAYTSAGLMTSLTDPRNKVTTFTWNPLGLMTRDEDPEGGAKNLDRVETANGHTVSVSTAGGRTTAYTLDTLTTADKSRRFVDPAGGTSTLMQLKSGVATATLADGMTLTSTEAPDPVWGMQSPFASTATMRWPSGRSLTSTVTREATLSQPGNPLSLTKRTDRVTVNGKTTTRVFDRASLTETVTSPMGVQRRIVFDAAGRTRRAESPSFLPVDVNYDARGRIASIVQGNRTHSFGYDAKNDMTSAQDPSGRTVRFEYDTAGRVTKQTLPDLGEIVFAYDLAGNLASITPPGRSAHTFSYNGVNRSTDYAPPLLGGTGGTHFVYNLDRDLERIVRPDGTAIDLAYDAAGRLRTLGFGTASRTYGYDGAGRLQSIVGADASLSYAYDGSLPTSVTWQGPVSGSVSWNYDLNGMLSSESVSGQPVALAYDDDGVLETAGDLIVYLWGGSHLLDSTEVQNAWESFRFNDYGELDELYQDVAVGASYRVVMDTFYNRDDAGRLTGVSETLDGVESAAGYFYDAAGRLEDVAYPNATVHYTWDANGNRMSKTMSGFGGGTPVVETATYDGHDRLTNYEGTQYTYTAAGELATKQDALGTTSYDYDALGSLLKTTLPGGTAVEYLIDGENRRVGRKVNGTVTHRWLYSDQRIVAELDGTGAVAKRFVYAIRTNVPDYMVAGGVTYRIYTDHHGSPHSVVDVATGATVASLRYDEFGVVLGDTNPGFIPFGFAGGLYDPATGLTRFGARDYDARVGRWTSKDPIGFEGGDVNLYGYTFGDPVNFIDSTGLWSTGIHNKIIDTAFQGTLSGSDIESLKDASEFVDEDQSLAGSYKHAMRYEGQSVEDAHAAYRNYVCGHFENAKRLEKNSKHAEAIKELGQAFHPLMDGTSPAHVGFQVWRGIKGHLMEANAHRRKESSISKTQLDSTAGILRSYYDAFRKGGKCPCR